MFFVYSQYTFNYKAHDGSVSQKVQASGERGWIGNWHCNVNNSLLPHGQRVSSFFYYLALLAHLHFKQNPLGGRVSQPSNE